MPQMIVTVPHALGQEEATARLTKKMEEVKAKHLYAVQDLVETWPDPNTLEFSFKALGFAVSGHCSSKPDAVTLDLDLPVAAVLVKGMIEAEIKKELRSVLQS